MNSFSKLKGRMNGISLFTGYGGIDIALREYVRTILYCEVEKYPQGIILSRMDEGSLEFAPTWNDVTTINGKLFEGLVDIVFGGFPCQDLSVAGKGAGLAGKRSGLFYEVIRICKEASPTFIFLENVPAIRTRGSLQVQEALASIGYDTRWTTLSASEVGANHKRERWFCLAIRREALLNTESAGKLIVCSEWEKETKTEWNGEASGAMANSMLNGPHGTEKRPGTPEELGDSTPWKNNSTITKGRQKTIRWNLPEPDGCKVSNTDCTGLQKKGSKTNTARVKQYGALDSEWWEVEPGLDRVVNGCPNRVDRIKALGNGVVPLQVKKAFETLMGINK